MRATPARWLLLAVAALLMLATTSGCVQIPTDSPVSQGRAVGIQEEGPSSGYTPEGPRPGASQDEIVTGYILAMLGYPQTPSTAREFMAPEAAADWDPASRVVVYQDQEVTEITRGRLFSATILGSLDERGSWTSAEPNEIELDLALRLTRVDGEWRITNPPNGTFVDRDYFDGYYEARSLYFFDQTSTVLVPDPVHVLAGDTEATTLVRNLLLGPTSDLAGVVATAAPRSIEVDVAVSTSDSGVAEIPLNEAARDLSEEDRQLFAVQVAWTLRQVADIKEIELTADGTTLEVSGEGRSFAVGSFPFYDPAGLKASRQLFALSSKGLVTFFDDEQTPVVGPITQNMAKARTVAVDPTATFAALVSEDGRRVTVGPLSDSAGGSADVRFGSGTDLLKPSWDTHAVLWLVDRTRTGAVLRTSTDSATRVIRAPGVTGQDVRAFAVSRDGARLAVVVGEGDESRLLISVIDRTPGAPGDVRLSAPREVVNPEYALDELSGLAWVSPTALAVLAKEEGGDTQPYEVDIDGSQVQPSPGILPVRPITLAAGPNEDAPIVVGTRRGELYIQNADQPWEALDAEGLYAPVYPG